MLPISPFMQIIFYNSEQSEQLSQASDGTTLDYHGPKVPKSIDPFCLIYCLQKNGSNGKKRPCGYTFSQDLFASSDRLRSMIFRHWPINDGATGRTSGLIISWSTSQNEFHRIIPLTRETDIKFSKEDMTINKRDDNLAQVLLVAKTIMDMMRD